MDTPTYETERPASRAARAERLPLGRGVSPAIRSLGRVLVVEDDRDLLGTACEVLAECGFDARAAASAEDAMAQLERDAPQCVLLDLCLPHLSAYELLVRLGGDERWRSVAVAAMTAYPTEVAISEGLADAFLAKPFTLEALEGLMGALCGSSAAASGGIARAGTA
jgi:DNA-binding response OmpR family regulator